jgi:uncharacterized protein (TIGR02611 family)
MKFIKRWMIIISGGFVTVVGLILMPVPGPGGLPVTLAGLAILATELPWAKGVMERLKQRVEFLRIEKRNRWVHAGIIGGVITFYLATSIVVVRIFSQ